ncbi:MAG: FKBP-type peptidyl-prolyl cis-trans isomerase [Cytophagales bacterium]|nr:FKBP-type peptidyl-prolyl cis-trans isomerase [Cytophagales bacterium]
MPSFKKSFLIFIISALLLYTACNKSGEADYKKSDTGLMYYFYKDTAGTNAKVGDFVTLHFSYKTNNTSQPDSMLRNTWKDGMPISVMVQEPSFKGGLEEGLAMLSVGDSAVFKMSADSLFRKTFMAPMPAFIDTGSMITFTMKILKIQDRTTFEEEQRKAMEERRKMMEAQAEAQKVVDDKLITDYLQQNGIKATKTNSGLYYIITKPGKGKNATSGDNIFVNYKGSLLNGSVFDSSEGKDPLNFKLGTGMVIPGWDEGLSYFNQGSKGKLYIPSPIGYGPMPMGEKIPANSVLVFDVEMVKIAK